MTTPTPTTLVARSPQDLLAVVPVVLGFVPQDSVVMLTFGARSAFHARIDLPPPEQAGEAVEALLEPARRHRVRRVVFLLYTEDARRAERVCRALVTDFERAGVEVVEALRADGRRWFALLPGRHGVPEWGVPYDVSAHPFAVQAVVDGRVTHDSRAALAASLAPDPARVAALASTVAEGRSDGWAEPARGAAEAGWVRATVCRHVAAGTVPDDAEAARLLADLRVVALRDVAWSLLVRETARDHVGFWTDLVRRCPADLAAAPTALLGFAAWLAGHGALAWCAVDACLEADPDYGLADILSQLLAHAVPPAEWEHEMGWADVFDDPA
jgi:Domain of unknown function (DUF4192)